MRKEILFAILSIIFISGCIQGIMTPEDIAKNSAEVKAFLNEYPHATVIATLFSNISINEECGNPQLPIKDYWKVTVKDPDTNMTLIAYIDTDSKETVCAIKTGGNAPIITKPKIYCKDNESLCQEILSNCTDSILIMETSAQGYSWSTTFNLNIANKVSSCHVLWNVDKSDNTEFKNTSMICDIPMINGKTVSDRNSADYCEGSFKDKLGSAPSGFLGPTARGFGQVQVLTPWSISTADGAMTLNVQNRVGGTITIIDVSYTLTNGGTGTYHNTPICSSGCSSGTSIASGGTAVLVTTPSGASNIGTSGATYTATVTITYTYGGGTFSSTGTLTGTYSTETNLTGSVGGFGQIQVLNPWSFSTGGTLTLNLENRVGGTITVSSINATITGGGSGSGGEIPTCSGGCVSGTDVTSGGKAVFSVNIPNIQTGTLGSNYAAVVSIYYNYPAGSSNLFSSTGTIRGAYS